MYFILEEMQYELGDTPIDNIFINDYMPDADGTYVKVYLMGYKWAKERQSFNNETLAKKFKNTFDGCIKCMELLGKRRYSHKA
jgi:hypothetical protein